MIALPTDEFIESELAPYGAVVSRAQAKAIRTYIELLLRWNRKLSLTTVTDVTEILRFHIGESIFATTLGLTNKSRLADVGSGAGLPGIPLAIFLNEMDVILIEANVKKASFLAEVGRALGLRNIRVVRHRFEDEVDSVNSRVDFVAARALGQYEELLKWSSKRLVASGRVFLWLGSEDAQRISQDYEWLWKLPQKIPGTANRVILIGQPCVGPTAL